MKSACIAAALVFSVFSVASAQQQLVSEKKSVPPTVGVSHAFAQEQMVWHAVQEGDVAGFNKLVAGAFTYINSSGITAWNAATSERLKDCTTTDFASSNVHTQQPAPGIVILSYQADLKQVCRGVKSPSPIYVLSAWQRTGTSWKLIAHSESHGHAAP